MSISSSLSNAASGLAAAARTAEVISSNVANANTDGYGRRDVSLAAQGITGGVRIQGVTRSVNDAAISDRRLADASLGNSTPKVNFFTRVERAVGLPGDPGSLSTSVSNLDASLLTASASPESLSSLNTVVSSAKEVTNAINSVANEIQIARQSADADIAAQITQLNSALANVDDLNKDIRRMTTSGGDPSGLMDQRQQEIDRISAFIPLRELPRDHNQIALVTEAGATLVDYDAASFEFEPTPIITPDMTLASGALSGLTLVNAASGIGSPIQAIAGGALAAKFEVRDDLAVAAQTQLDAVSRHLIERFSGPTADPTLAAGQAGLFTDAGSDFDVVNEVGVSGRLVISSLVDPEAGGDPTKIRDGIGSVTPRPVGDNAVLVSLRSALDEPGVPSTGQFGSAASFAGISSELLSGFATSRTVSETQQAFDVSRATALKDIEQQSGVSTDDELQKLLLVEQAYAANARVIQAVDEMMQSLLRI